MLHYYLFLHNIFKNKEPKYLFNKLQPHAHDYLTRNRGNLRVPAHRTACYHNAFSCVAVRLWNSLANELKDKTRSYFRKQIHIILMQEQSYLYTTN